MRKALKTENMLKSTSCIETIRKPVLIKNDNKMYKAKILNKAENLPLKIFWFRVEILFEDIVLKKRKLTIKF